jgi:hypothetical protein
MSTVYYKPPREVFQDPKKFTCWAAALESWMSVTPESPMNWLIKTQDDAIRNWADFTGDNGGLNVQSGFKWMAAACGMEYSVFPDAKELTGNFLHAKLKARRYLYFFFAGGETNLGNGLAHASVIYEISKPWSKDCSISVMDPWVGKGIRPGQPLEVYRQAKEAVIAWLEL